MENVISFIKNNPDLDSSNLTLATISNGGRAVPRLIQEYSKMFSRLILISSVMEPKLYTSEHFLNLWKEKPFYILHCGKDVRVPWDAISKINQQLTEKGIKTTVRLYPQEDHFFFLSKRSQVAKDLVQWLGPYFTQI